MNLLNTCRKFLLCTAINDSSLCTKTKRRTGSVHGNITATYDNHLLAGMDRSVIVRTVSLHKVVSCQKLICREYAVEMFSWNIHETRKTCSRAHKHSIKTFLIKKAVYSDCTPCYHIGLDLYTQSLYRSDLSRYHLILRKTELRNTILKHSTCAMKSLEHCHIITELGKVRSTCKTCGTAADNSNLMTVCRSYCRLHATIFPAPVSNEALKLADSNRLALYAKDTASLTLSLLRTYSSAYCRKRRIFCYCCRSSCEISCRYK